MAIDKVLHQKLLHFRGGKIMFVDLQKTDLDPEGFTRVSSQAQYHPTRKDGIPAILMRNDNTGLYVLYYGNCCTVSCPQPWARKIDEVAQKSKLRIARENAGLTQKQLADTVGVAANHLQQWEYRQKKPSGENLIRLADALNVNPKELIDTDNQKTKGE
jgi:DNA-binding XRE family transcriptional regulator